MPKKQTVQQLKSELGRLKAKKPVAVASKKLKARAKIRGQGDFFSDAFNGVKNFGRKVLGQGIHKGINWLSNRAHDAVKGVIGNGDYLLPGAPIDYNSLYAGASVAPKFENNGHSNTIQHRESLGVIRSSAAFQRTTLTFNPGLRVFPWLSVIAPAWQRYKVHGAIVEWIPAVTPLNTNAGGRVVLSSRYDLSTAAPTSVQQAEVTFGAVVGRPMDQMAMPIECKPTMQAVNALNVRFGELPAGANAQFFDHCLIDVCNAGQADASSDIGEVFITYDVEFLFPIAEHLSNSVVQSLVAYSAISTAAPSGTPGTNLWTKRIGSSLPCDITAGATTLQVDLDSLQPLPIGSTWLVSVELTATTAITAPTLTFGSDLGQYTPVYKSAAGADSFFYATGASTTAYSLDFAFKVNAATTNQSFLLGSMAIAATGSGYGTIVITPLVSGLATIRMRARYPDLYSLQDLLTAKFQVIDDCEEMSHAIIKREGTHDRGPSDYMIVEEKAPDISKVLTTIRRPLVLAA